MQLANDTVLGLVYFAILAMGWLVWEMAQMLREIRREMKEIRTLLHDVTRTAPLDLESSGWNRAIATCHMDYGRDLR